MSERTTRMPRFSAKASGKRGEIHVYDVIGDDWFGITAKQVVDALEQFSKDGIEALDVYVNSPGGSAFDGVAIHNALRRFDGEKTVYVDGLAASAASVVALAGDRIVTGPGAMWMVHNPSSLAYGESADLRKTADTLDSLRDSVLSLYASRTGQNSDDLRRWMDAETWMDAATAKQRGFCHEVAEQEQSPETEPENAADFSLVLAHFKNAPGRVAELLNRSRARASMRAANQEPPKMKKLLAALGLTESATETEALAALDKHVALSAEVAKLTGETDANKAVAVLSATKEKAARADELTAKLSAVEAEQKQAKLTSMLDEATKSGRLTPANREKLSAADAPAFAREPETLATFLSMLPAAVPTVTAPKSDSPAVSLTAEERAVAKQMGLDEKAVAARKAARAQ